MSSTRKGAGRGFAMCRRADPTMATTWASNPHLLARAPLHLDLALHSAPGVLTRIAR